VAGLGEARAELVDHGPDALELGGDSALHVRDLERRQGGVGHGRQG
jgi:hypothetical protein